MFKMCLMLAKDGICFNLIVCIWHVCLLVYVHAYLFKKCYSLKENGQGPSQHSMWSIPEGIL